MVPITPVQRLAAPVITRLGAKFGIKDVAMIMIGLEAVDLAWHWAKQYRHKDRFDRIEKRIAGLEQRIDMFSRNGDAQALKAPEPVAEVQAPAGQNSQTLDRLTQLVGQLAEKLSTPKAAA